MDTGGALSISSGVDRDSVPSTVRICVRDEGSGIPQDLRTRIFDPLFTTKAGGTGRGLGLNIVSGFVRQSNGAIEVDSAEGRGTRVTLSFPAVD